MLYAKNWFAEVVSPSTMDAAALFAAQAKFIREFMSVLFKDSDAGQNSLGAVKSIHFARLAQDVRFRILAAKKDLPAITRTVEERLEAAKNAGLILDHRCEDAGPWERPGDPRYGTDTPGVAEPFAEFLEAISRATTMLLKASGDSAVSERVLWRWLHMVHNQMNGSKRIVLEVTGTAWEL